MTQSTQPLPPTPEPVPPAQPQPVPPAQVAQPVPPAQQQPVPPAQGHMDVLPVPSDEPQAVVPQAVEQAPQPAAQPTAYRAGKKLFFENGAMPHTHQCPKTGRKSKVTKSVGLSSPTNPVSWLKPAVVVELGLSNKANENHKVQTALGWTLSGLGILMVLVGAVTLSIVTLIPGLLLAVGGQIVRALSPISATKQGDAIVLSGCCDAYLEQYSELDEVQW